MNENMWKEGRVAKREVWNGKSKRRGTGGQDKNSCNKIQCLRIQVPVGGQEGQKGDGGEHEMRFKRRVLGEMGLGDGDWLGSKAPSGQGSCGNAAQESVVVDLHLLCRRRRLSSITLLLLPLLILLLLLLLLLVAVLTTSSSAGA